MFLINFIKERIWRSVSVRPSTRPTSGTTVQATATMSLTSEDVLRVVAKKDIKALIARRVGFRRGVKIADIEKRALYITPLGNVLSK